MLAYTTAAITWISFPKPQYDPIGLVLAALGLAGLVAGLATVLGAGLGFLLIRRRREKEIGEGVIHLGLYRSNPLPERVQHPL